ncbi:identical protein binding, partial [Homalodisca vitripennis]
EELKLEREWRGIGGSGEKPKVAQLIQDCESRLAGPRKYSSFDSLKDRNAGCFLKDSKPDVVSSCQDRLKSTGSDDTFKTAETSERKSSCSDITTVDSICARKISNGSDGGKSGDLSEKSTGSDDVFKVIDSLGRSSKKSTELAETFKDDSDRSPYHQPSHVRNKSDDSDSVFVSDSDAKSEPSEGKVSSLKAKIEMFSKVSSDQEKPKPLVNRGIKPKVPARTFRLTPENPVPPRVQARVVPSNDSEEKPIEINPSYAPKDKVFKERGKLDKSYSTPAYDFSPDAEKISVTEKINLLKQKFLADSKMETRSDSAFEDSRSDIESLSGKDDDVKTNDNSISTSIPSISEEFGESEKEVHGQIVETINKHLLTLDYETDSEPKWKDKNITANLDPDPLRESEQKIGKILDTLNISIIEYRKEMERESKVRKSSTEGADLSKTISQVCKEEILQTYNPSGFMMSKPTSLENLSEPKMKGGVIPVPPRVRITPPTIHEERLGLPDVTITSALPETPRRKPVSSLDFVDKPNVTPAPAPATFPRQKAESRRPITPPEPPPRPTPPAPAVQPKGACYRAMMVAKSISKTTKVASPRSLRKKNPLLAKHRNVTLKDLGMNECEGWLQQRCRRGSGQWNRGWFVIKGTTFYGFKHKEASKADVMISLPGFTVSDAEEVKSRRFAFKVYHTGTMFYFAADNHEEMTLWMDCITVATRAQDSHSTTPLFSESEGEGSGEEGGSGSCFPSPKMKKLAGLLGSPSKSSPSSSSSSTLDK